jgi:hypothetical protein
MTAMSVFACICETIAIFERDVLKPPCEIALDPRVYDLLECEVRERGLVEFGTVRVAFAPASSLTIHGVRIVRA